ncbi:hypothetical protein L227DRAFT_205680 [Lentinus tigrinus ALCF2SS1-6]|uniref:Uncharacterized protein n=1 Tax=Lentinus tigrinus ALCF2SS1-6 TaxID=1328759 RepID=A0A5C2SN48_9APHY|nr:hypothetical protein L227DRAFT_205680 [Lentinus tigrinus ALCF2SS1-6]
MPSLNVNGRYVSWFGRELQYSEAPRFDGLYAMKYRKTPFSQASDPRVRNPLSSSIASSLDEVAIFMASLLSGEPQIDEGIPHNRGGFRMQYVAHHDIVGAVSSHRELPYSETRCQALAGKTDTRTLVWAKYSQGQTYMRMLLGRRTGGGVQSRERCS